MYGGDGDDQILGQGGRDVMFGGSGNDTYLVAGDNGGNVDDRVIEKPIEGIDSVQAFGSYTLPANVENLYLQYFGAGFATGNQLNNIISGSEAGDYGIDGKGGTDTLTGGGGADEFDFSTALGAGNIDTITDFVSGTDRIDLRSSIFGNLPTSSGTLAASAFYVGTQAHDADDRIIYNASTHALYFDADGIGGVAQVQFAIVNGTAPLATDITVF